jgi:hypothetical protein
VLRLAAGFLLNTAASRLRAFELRSAVKAVAERRPTASVQSRCCRYRVNATVILGCIPIFSKQNVGGAYLSLEESGGPQCKVTCLQFAAGSCPDRLKGFNRFGATQEAVREEQGAVIESAYLSFITGGHETNYKDAREAFAASPGSLPFTIARGKSTQMGLTSEIEHRTVPATYSWSNCLDLADELQASLPLSAEKPVQESAGRALPTFLFAVRRTLLNGCEKSAVPFMHNGKVYCLRARLQVDPRSGELMISGRIAASGERNETEFRFWTVSHDDSVLPKRIEFRPKSFLKLVLEADSAQSGPVLRPLFKQEE